MPLFKKGPVCDKFSTMPILTEANVEIEFAEGDEALKAHFPVAGEIIQSFDIADTPGGWHLVWLDEAFEHEGQVHAHLMIAARWVARPITRGQIAPINIRFVPDVALVQKGAPDIEKLPFAAKGTAVLV